jgi:hypothetical protein
VLGEMKLKNYTTGVSAIRTIGEIEQILASLGATSIMKDYFGDGRVSGLSFKLTIKERQMAIKIPVEIEKATAILIEQDAMKKKNDIWRQQQSERVFWRIIKDWLFSQFSLIEIGQAKPEQIFLPYMWNGRETLYEKLEKSGFKALELEASKDENKVPKLDYRNVQDAEFT